MVPEHGARDNKQVDTLDLLVHLCNKYNLTILDGSVTNATQGISLSMTPPCVKDINDFNLSKKVGGTILFVRLRNLSLPNRCFILGKPLVSTIEFPMDALCSIDATPRKTRAFFSTGHCRPYHTTRSTPSSLCLLVFSASTSTYSNN